MSGGYTCLVSRISSQHRDGSGTDWEAARRRPRGCVQSQRLEDITRLSAGGRRREFRRGSRRRPRRARGQPATKRALFFPPPGAGTNGLAAAEVICQAKPGVKLRMGPQGWSLHELPLWGGASWSTQAGGCLFWDSVSRSVQQGRSCLSCPYLGLLIWGM